MGVAGLKFDVGKIDDADLKVPAFGHADGSPVEHHLPAMQGALKAEHVTRESSFGEIEFGVVRHLPFGSGIDVQTSRRRMRLGDVVGFVGSEETLRGIALRGSHAIGAEGEVVVQCCGPWRLREALARRALRIAQTRARAEAAAGIKP